MKENKQGFMGMGFTMMIISFIYLFAITFIKIPTENNSIMLVVVGYISGILSCITTYFFGSSFLPNPNKNNSETSSIDLKENISNNDQIIENESKEINS